MGHKDMEGDDIKTVVARWDKANKTYFGPDRDFKNFPVLKMPEHPPPIRMGVFPSSWFDAFYEKTGVTGETITIGIEITGKKKLLTYKRNERILFLSVLNGWQYVYRKLFHLTCYANHILFFNLGPYVFVTSGVVFLLSKEFLLSGHYLMETISFIGMLVFYKWILGDAIKKFLNEYNYVSIKYTVLWITNITTYSPSLSFQKLNLMHNMSFI